MEIRNAAREGARILHDMNDLRRQPWGSLWRESPLRDGQGSVVSRCEPYIVATGDPDRPFIAISKDDGSRHLTPEDEGIFLPGTHDPQFPLIEVTDGTQIVFGGRTVERDAA